MKFSVPQFIESESKIVAFLTIRQFVILLSAGGLITLTVLSGVNSIIMVILIFLIFGAAVVLAFVKVNGQLFHQFFINMLLYISKGSIRVWRKEELDEDKYVKMKSKQKENLEKNKQENQIVAKRPLNRKNLSELSLLVDTGGSFKQEK